MLLSCTTTKKRSYDGGDDNGTEQHMNCTQCKKKISHRNALTEWILRDVYTVCARARKRTTLSKNHTTLHNICLVILHTDWNTKWRLNACDKRNKKKMLSSEHVWSFFFLVNSTKQMFYNIKNNPKMKRVKTSHGKSRYTHKKLA